MNDKELLIVQLRDVFNEWETLLAGMSEEQIAAPHPSSGWSVKDELAHLWAWQQISVARMEAALQGREPEYPMRPERLLGLDPDEDVQVTNDWVYETNRDKPWQSVYNDWRAQFVSLIELSQQVPESDLLQEGKYPWLERYPLSAVLTGTYNHHSEHLDDLHSRHAQSA